MFEHPLSLRTRCLFIHHVYQFSLQNAKKVRARPFAKNSTAILKNSTEMSAASARFSNYAGGLIDKRSDLCFPIRQIFAQHD